MEAFFQKDSDDEEDRIESSYNDSIKFLEEEDEVSSISSFFLAAALPNQPTRNWG